MDSTSFKESTPTGPKFGEVSAKKLAKSEEASASRFRASSTAVLPSGVVFKHAADAFNMLLPQTGKGVEQVEHEKQVGLWRGPGCL